MSQQACPNCGRLNRPGAKRCAGCGRPLSAQAVPSQPAQAPRVPPAPQAPRQQQAPRVQPGPQVPRTPPPQSPSRPSLPLRPWQFALVGGIAVIVCLVGSLAIAAPRLLGQSGHATETITPALETRVAPSVTPVSPSPTTVVIVVTATPPPASPTSTPAQPTAVPATQAPSQTPTSPPTASPSPTPAATPTATLQPTDTPKGSTLTPGLTWRQKPLEMTLANPKFSSLECKTVVMFDVTLTNTSTASVRVDISGDQWGVQDNKNKGYSVIYKLGSQTSGNNCADYGPIEDLKLAVLDPGQTLKLAMRAVGDLDSSVLFYSFTVAKAGTIQAARWQMALPVPSSPTEGP